MFCREILFEFFFLWVFHWCIYHYEVLSHNGQFQAPGNERGLVGKRRGWIPLGADLTNH